MTNKELIQILEVYKHTAHSKCYREAASMCLELAKTDAPMKPNDIKMKIDDLIAKCCSCGFALMEGNNFCARCGQRIDCSEAYEEKLDWGR